VVGFKKNKGRDQNGETGNKEGNLVRKGKQRGKQRAKAKKSIEGIRRKGEAKSRGGY